MLGNQELLLITEVCPGPWDGSSQYQRQLAFALAELGYKVHVIFAEGRGQIQEDLRAYSASLTGPFVKETSVLVRRMHQVWTAVRGKSLTCARACPKVMKEKTLELLNDLTPNVVVVSHLRVGEFIPILRRHCQGVRIVFVCHNCETDVRRLYLRHGGRTDRLAARIDLPRVYALEREAVEQSDAVVVLSERDAELVRTLFQPPSVCVVPPVITPVPGECFGGRADAKEEPRILCCETMSYRAKQINVEWLVTEIYPRVLKRIPDARLDVVGRSAPRGVVKAGRRYPKLAVTGWVEDVVPYYQRATVCVLPTLVGGGFELKTLEAARLGCPIVGTPIPLRAAGFEDGRHCLEAESADELSDALVRVLTEPALAKRLARMAWTHACKNFGHGEFTRRLAGALVGGKESTS